MLLSLFPNVVSAAELKAAAQQEELDLPFVLPPDDMPEQPSADPKMLIPLVHMLAGATAQLYLELEQSQSRLPLSAILVAQQHLFAVVYRYDGLMLYELMSPADVKKPLLSAFAMLPVPSDRDTQLLLQQAMSPDVMMRQLREGKVPEALQAETAALLLQAVAQGRTLRCTFTQIDKETEIAYAIAGKQGAWTLSAEENETALTTGSLLPLLRKLNMQLIMAYQASLKTADAD